MTPSSVEEVQLLQQEAVECPEAVPSEEVSISFILRRATTVQGIATEKRLDLAEASALNVGVKSIVHRADHVASTLFFRRTRVRFLM